MLLQAITAGGGEESYKHEGYNKHTILEFTSPFESIASTCSMEYKEPFTILGIHRGLPENEVRYHAERYRQFIVNLRESDATIEGGE